MQVGFLISGSLDTLTGGYIYDRQLVDYLRQNGHSVDIIPLSCHSYFDRLLQSPKFPSFKALNRLPLDVLLQDELDHPALILLNHKLKRQVHYPIVSIVHNLHSCELRARWQNQLYRQIEKLYLMSVDSFVYNSRATRQVVESLIGASRPGIIACPCGDRLSAHITEAEIKERAQAPGPFRILFLGNLFRNKGLHILLDALVKLPDNNYVLTVVGDLTMERSYVKSILSQIREHNLNDKVTLTGPLNNSALVAKLMESHVLVVPSFYEGYGIAYLEGMGFGLPVIGTRAGGAAEIITHGQNGYLISPGDSTILSEYLRELNNKRDSLISMSLKALQRFSSHPSWQTTCEKILSFLLSLRSSSSQSV